MRVEHRGVRISVTALKVLELLNEQPDWGTGALAARLRVTDGRVSQILKELREKGLVERRSRYAPID